MKIILYTFLSSLLIGCTISTPLNVHNEKRQGVAVVTEAELVGDERKRKFFDYSYLIHSRLPSQRGFLGGSIRRQLFGEKAWTLTVWENQRALNDFIHSRDHLDGMYMASDAIVRMRSVSFEIDQAAEITWDLALERLERAPLRKVP